MYSGEAGHCVYAEGAISKPINVTNYTLFLYNNLPKFSTAFIAQEGKKVCQYSSSVSATTKLRGQEHCIL